MAKAKSSPAHQVEGPEMADLTALEPIRHGVAQVAPGEEFYALPADAEALIACGAAALTVAAAD